MNMSKLPKSSEGQTGGPLRGRELVNPNITQSAPEVKQEFDVLSLLPEFESSLLCHRLELVLVLLFQWVDISGRENSMRNERGRNSAEDKGREDRASLRLQDRELQEMSDGGWCLSMHQPWASLLVRGIKR